MWQVQGLRVGAEAVLTPGAQGAGVTIPDVLPPEPPDRDIKTCEPFSAVAELPSQWSDVDSKPTHLLAVGWNRVQADPSQAQ